MQARILPGRGSGARSRTASSGRASPSRALRSSAERRPSKPSMRACMVACGVWARGPTSAMLTTPRSVSRPGRAGWPGCSKSTSLTVASARAPRSGAACVLDLLRRVAERAEHPVVQPRPAGLVDEVRAHELPHHLAAGGHLEDAPVAALADQRVAVGQALRARDVGAEEVEERLVAIFPYDRARARVYFDYARVRRGMITAVGPLSKIRRLPLDSGRGSCCWASGGLPSDRVIVPVRRSTMATVEMLRKLTTKLPSTSSATVLACVHSTR